MRWLVLLLASVLIAAAAWWSFGDDVQAPPVSVRGDTLPETSSPRMQGATLDGAERTVLADEELAPPPRRPLPEFGPGAVFVVVDEAGRPIEDAVVEAVLGEGPLPHVQTHAVTDAQGRATVRGAWPEARHRVSACGHWPVVGEGCVVGTTTRAVLHAAPRLTGVVFDAAGAPVAGAQVGVIATERFEARMETVCTDGHGRFQSAWPDARAHDLVVTARGHAPEIVRAIRYETHGSAPVVVHLRAGAILTGVVRDAAGAPLVGVRVEVSTVRDEPVSDDKALGPPSRRNIGRQLALVTCEVGGEFVARDLPAVPVVVSIAADLVAAGAQATLAPGHTTKVELRAGQNGAISGEVSDCRGRKVLVLLAGGPNVREHWTTDGTFAFRDVPHGRYMVEAVASGDSYRRLLAASGYEGAATEPAVLVELASAERRQLVLPAPGVVAGVVTGTARIAGAPAAGHVLALDAVDGLSSAFYATELGADGAFRFDDVHPQEYFVRLRTRRHQVLAEVRCVVAVGDNPPITLSAP